MAGITGCGKSVLNRTRAPSPLRCPDGASGERDSPRTVKTQPLAYAADARTYRLAVAGASERESGKSRRSKAASTLRPRKSKAPRPTARRSTGARTPSRTQSSETLPAANAATKRSEPRLAASPLHLPSIKRKAPSMPLLPSAFCVLLRPTNSIS